ncbi:MAG: response regulator [Pirellulales bacterium]
MVLLDLVMPGMSGVETFHEIKKVRSDTAVVISSGYGDQSAQDDWGELRPSGFLPKPYGMDELMQCIRNAMR